MYAPTKRLHNSYGTSYEIETYIYTHIRNLRACVSRDNTKSLISIVFPLQKFVPPCSALKKRIASCRFECENIFFIQKNSTLSHAATASITTPTSTSADPSSMPPCVTHTHFFAARALTVTRPSSIGWCPAPRRRPTSFTRSTCSKGPITVSHGPT